MNHQARRILIVEDNDLNSKLAREILRLQGFETVSAGTGVEAVETAQTQPFDLILMDIQLPEMDGLTATRELKGSEQTAGIPVLAVSALARLEDREAALEAGCDGYLPKPYSLKGLIDAVNATLATV